MLAFWIVLAGVIGLAIGGLVAFVIIKNRTNSKLHIADKAVEEASDEADRIRKSAERDAETAMKEALIAAREEAMKLKQQNEHEDAKRKNELRNLETRIIQREESLDRRNDALNTREDSLQQAQLSLDVRNAELDAMFASQNDELERIASFTQQEARDELIARVKEQVVVEEAQILRDSEARVRATAERTAREIISVAIQRAASDQAGEITVTTVHIPSDDLKGRIIGREGRNIRTFEQISGVSLVIDDTPETVVLSCFDPVRRETARVALENLIADGRIHPARIEEMYKKAEKLVHERVMEAGEQAAFEAGIHDLKPEIIETLGALKYRASYGQNVLQHSVQVAELAGLMASELGFDETIAKRAGLLHDLGKATSQEAGGSHAVIGAELLKKTGENPEVVHAVAAHHNDVEPNSVLDMLIMAADAVSAARPGARRESAEAYIKRLEQLEEISNAHKGVEKTYAMQAGREIHVMVQPEQVSDEDSRVLAHDIAQEIESEMQYPGEVRVVVIRESRAIETAK